MTGTRRQRARVSGVGAGATRGRSRARRSEIGRLALRRLLSERADAAVRSNRQLAGRHAAHDSFVLQHNGAPPRHSHSANPHAARPRAVTTTPLSLQSDQRCRSSVYSYCPSAAPSPHTIFLCRAGHPPARRPGTVCHSEPPSLTCGGPSVMPRALIELTPPHAAGGAASEPSRRSTTSAGTNCAAAAAAAGQPARAPPAIADATNTTAFNLTELPSVACGPASGPRYLRSLPNRPPAATRGRHNHIQCISSIGSLRALTSRLLRCGGSRQRAARKPARTPAPHGPGRLLPRRAFPG